MVTLRDAVATPLGIQMIFEATYPLTNVSVMDPMHVVCAKTCTGLTDPELIEGHAKGPWMISTGSMHLAVPEGLLLAAGVCVALALGRGRMKTRGAVAMK